MTSRFYAGLMISAAMTASANAAEGDYPSQPLPSYSFSDVDQFSPSPLADVIPDVPSVRRAMARVIAAEAVIYGLPSVLQYEQMYNQAINEKNPKYVGFNRFGHDRNLAGPDYTAFKVPNSDTLYSNAWLDLSRGPVFIDVPAIPLKYYTLCFLDMYSNASNISSRTFGSEARRYLVAPANWKGEVPEGVTLFRVATEYTWILMRIFASSPAEVARVRRIQDEVVITPTAKPADARVDYPVADKQTPAGFFRNLDFLLRTNAHPKQEDALVYRFRSLGLGGAKPFDFDGLDPETRAGIEDGFADAMKIVKASQAQLGVRTANGWNKVEKARYGFNYLNRATINYVGLGANVSAENHSFNAFEDSSGMILDGGKANYSFELSPPPPVNAFWSVTLYDGESFELYDNTLRRYLINDRTPGLKVEKDGSIKIVIAHRKVAGKANWLPAPDKPFFVVLRAYGPKPELLEGKWVPQAIKRMELPAD